MCKFAKCILDPRYPNTANGLSSGKANGGHLLRPPQ